MNVSVPAILLALAIAANAETPVSVRLLLGIGDKAVTKWDGSLEAEGAHVDALEPWRFEGPDTLSGSSWRMSSREPRLFGGANQANANRPVVANGVIVRLSAVSPGARLKVRSAQGDFEIGINEIPYGTSVTKLNGRAFADRVPSPTRITETPDEEDYPAAAIDKNGGIWMSYITFHHNPDHNRLRAPLKTAPAEFSPLKANPGGDQVFARRFRSGVWQEAIALTPSGGDLYRSAIALDGEGRPWIFWSRNTNGNFDIMARSIENGKPGPEVQISKDAGSDVFPVAATDFSGKVWVAWQGWRNGRASIFSATQQGSRFSAPARVSQSNGNEWNPAIAADQAGRVTIAWDSYRSGSYDVFLRTATKGEWGKEITIAASARYEAYPSLAYDKQSRLWVAYEEGGKGWGKDFGAYDTTGVALYQGRAIRLRGLEPDGRPIELTQNLGPTLPGLPKLLAENPGVQPENEPLDPDPNIAKSRAPNQAARNMLTSKNTMPRLAIDASGRIWLAFRTAHPIWWGALGTVWTENVVSYDGAKWSSPIFLPHTDNVLDNRPALVSTAAGNLTVIGSSDGRRQFLRPVDLNDRPDPFNNDLYSTEIQLGAATREAAVKPAPAIEAASGINPVDAAAVKRMRDFRVSDLKVVRGEFHRHSETSVDGGNDGSLLDQWRYILDAGSLDWVGCCDHDNGGGREYTWWTTQKLTDIFYSPGVFVPMFNYERSVPYPEGHRNVIFAQRGIRPLPRLPITQEDTPGHAPDTQMLYAYLKQFNGLVAAHTSGTGMGTDWRDNDPRVEPIVEIYQGDRQNYEMPDAPRSNSAKDSIGGWKPKGFINLALQKGYQLGFQASSDHISTHISYCNILVKNSTREAVLEGLQSRHVYASTDNILADVRSGAHLMGDAFSTSTAPSLQVKLTGTSKFAKVFIVKDNNYVYSIQPNTEEVSFTWMDNTMQPGKTSYYYVRGEQDDGNIVWVSPMWITFQGTR